MERERGEQDSCHSTTAVLVPPFGRWIRGETLCGICPYPDYDCDNADTEFYNESDVVLLLYSDSSIATIPGKAKVTTLISHNGCCEI